MPSFFGSVVLSFGARKLLFLRRWSRFRPVLLVFSVLAELDDLVEALKSQNFKILEFCKNEESGKFIEDLDKLGS